MTHLTVSKPRRVVHPSSPAARLLATVALISLVLGCGGLKDLRPDSIKAGPGPDAEARGRALLMRAAENVGGPGLLNEHDGFVVEMTDTWTNPMAKLMFLRYDAAQKIKVTATNPRVDNVTMELTSGEKIGEVWGLDNNRVYIEKDGTKTFTDDEITMLYVKNPAALVLAPSRLAYADKVAYIGRRTHKGKTYDAVFATWESYDVNETFDQWVIWIDPDTGDLAKAQFTIREYTGMLVSEAVAEFSDYTDHGGARIPHTISALFSLEGDIVRTWSVDSFAWVDSVRHADTIAPSSQPAATQATPSSL